MRTASRTTVFSAAPPAVIVFARSADGTKYFSTTLSLSAGLPELVEPEPPTPTVAVRAIARASHGPAVVAPPATGEVHRVPRDSTTYPSGRGSAVCNAL